MVFFFNDTATTEIYTLSLHDALPIYNSSARASATRGRLPPGAAPPRRRERRVWSSMSYVDRKSTRLNSSHANISYAVFCLKKTRKESTGAGRKRGQCDR